MNKLNVLPAFLTPVFVITGKLFIQILCSPVDIQWMHEVGFFKFNWQSRPDSDTSLQLSNPLFKECLTRYLYFRASLFHLVS